jgi:Rod binding domain-containing protein
MPPEVTDMMKKLRSRLRSKKGESIAEVLVAVLLSAIGLTMLATMISATSKMVIRSRNLTKEYVEQNNQLVEKADTSTRTGSVQVRRVDDDSSVATPIRLYDDPTANEEDASYFDIPVKYYVNSRVGNVEVTSYKKG